MQRENKNKKMSFPKFWRHAGFGNHNLVAVSEKGVDPRQKHSGMTPFFDNSVKGFTLIELLVVVLIIGILAAVALPKYEQAVAKSRLVQAYTQAKAIKDAEEVYYMANGTYTADIDMLNIDIGPVSATTSQSNWLSGVIQSTNATIELSFNVGNGFNPRILVGTPRVNNETWSRGYITYYFDNPTPGDTRSGIHCSGNTDVYQKACKSMGGTYIGNEGSGHKVYQLPN